MRPTARFAAFLVLLAVLGAARPAFADDEAEHGGESRSPVVLDLTQAIPALVVFALLLVVLAKTAWKPLLKGLQAREETIRKAVDDAAAASEKAKALVAQYEAKLEAARAEAQQVVEEGRRDGEALRRRIEEDAHRAVEETKQRATREIEQAQAKAFDEVLRDVAVIATEAASRIVRKTLPAAAHQELVDEVVREFAGRRAENRN
jgi:F-type H+-transporting ATPase subunit b